MAVVRAGGEHLGAINDPAVTVAHRAGLAGRDIGAAFGFGVAEAQPDMAAENSRYHLVLQFW